MKLSKKMKKILLISLIAAVVISVAGVGIYHIHKRNAEAAKRAHYVRFEDCKRDLNMLVDFLQAKYPKVEDRPTYLRVAGNKMLLQPGVGYVNLPDAVTASIKAVAEAGFVSEKTEWCMITFSNTRIQFDILSGAYALVYSPDGEPTYLHEPTEGFPICVEHIEGYWYHVTRTD